MQIPSAKPAGKKRKTFVPNRNQLQIKSPVANRPQENQEESNGDEKSRKMNENMQNQKKTTQSFRQTISRQFSAPNPLRNRISQIPAPRSRPLQASPYANPGFSPVRGGILLLSRASRLALSQHRKRTESDAPNKCKKGRWTLWRWRRKK